MGVAEGECMEEHEPMEDTLCRARDTRPLGESEEGGVWAKVRDERADMGEDGRGRV